MEYRICKTCGIEKTLTKENFPDRIARGDARQRVFRHICRCCQSLRALGNGVMVPNPCHNLITEWLLTSKINVAWIDRQLERINSASDVPCKIVTRAAGKYNYIALAYTESLKLPVIGSVKPKPIRRGVSCSTCRTEWRGACTYPCDECYYAVDEAGVFDRPHYRKRDKPRNIDLYDSIVVSSL